MQYDILDDNIDDDIYVESQAIKEPLDPVCRESDVRRIANNDPAEEGAQEGQGLPPHLHRS